MPSETRMKIVRNIAAVIVGYLIFAGSAVFLFNLSGIDPHAETDFRTKVGIICLGYIFAFSGGYVARVIAASSNLTVNFVLAFLIAGFAAFSLFKSPREHYTQIAAIFLFAPASLIGGIRRPSGK